MSESPENVDPSPQGAQTAKSSWALPAAGVALIGCLFFLSNCMERALLGDRIVGAEVMLSVVTGSDDYTRNARKFGQAAGKLIKEKGCTEAEIRDGGGFVRSMRHMPDPIYFTHCGGRRWYLDTDREVVFQ